MAVAALNIFAFVALVSASYIACGSISQQLAKMSELSLIKVDDISFSSSPMRLVAR